MNAEIGLILYINRISQTGRILVPGDALFFWRNAQKRFTRLARERLTALGPCYYAPSIRSHSLARARIPVTARNQVVVLLPAILRRVFPAVNSSGARLHLCVILLIIPGGVQRQFQWTQKAQVMINSNGRECKDEMSPVSRRPCSQAELFHNLCKHRSPYTLPKPLCCKCNLG